MKNRDHQKISTHLWFNDNAEEAANFYIGLFKNSSILKIARYGKNAPMPEGTAMSIVFELSGQEFVALNGGPYFTFNEAISLMVKCKDQAEIDAFWNAFTAEGHEGRCGWLKDKYGLSWQIIPTCLGSMLTDSDARKAQSVGAAMMQMNKIDIAVLEAAYI